MAEKILVVVGRLSVPGDEFWQQNPVEAAHFFAGLPGVRWKIFLNDEERGEAGGIYLFADEATYNDYVTGPIMADLRQFPLWTDLRVMGFDYMPEHSAITRAPVGDRVNGPDDGPLTFNRMVASAMAAVPAIEPATVHHRLSDEPDLLLIDVRDAADIAQTGTVPGAVNISYGALTYMADQGVPEDWRDPRLGNRARPIITTCILGPLGAMGGKWLHDMGFSNVGFLEGGVQGWQEAGFALRPFPN